MAKSHGEAHHPTARASKNRASLKVPKTKKKSAKPAESAGPIKVLKRGHIRKYRLAAKNSSLEGAPSVFDLLGGVEILHEQLFESQLAAHVAIRRGLPKRSAHFVVEHFESLNNPTFLRQALGLSKKTLQRHRRASESDDLLTSEQSGRVYSFVLIMEHASRVFGTKSEAENWLNSPAIALDNQLPIAMLETTVGTTMVQDLLTQIEYGAYI